MAAYYKRRRRKITVNLQIKRTNKKKERKKYNE